MPPRSRRRDAETVTPQSPHDDLTPQQWLFVRAYIAQDGNASAAYRTAYRVGDATKPETVTREAFRTRRLPNVAAALLTYETLRARASIVDRDLVIGIIVRNAHDARDAGDFQAVNRAAELLGKATGVFDAGNDEAASDLVAAIRRLAAGTQVSVESQYRELPAPGTQEQEQ